MLGNRQSIIYCNVINGKIAIAAKPGDPGATSYVNKQGETKYYVFHDFVEGKLTRIAKKGPPPNHPEYAETWNATIVDNGETYNLQLYVGGKLARAFFCTLPNLDASQPVRYEPKMKTYEGKPDTSLMVIQNGEALKWAYTNDDPGPRPPVEVTTLKSGKKVIDTTEQDNFFAQEAEAFNRTVHNVNEDVKQPENAPAESDESPYADVVGPGDDELPF